MRKLFDCPEILQAKIDGFWDWCVENNYIPDVEGLALYLDTSRKVINDYQHRQGYSEIIEKAKDRIFFFQKQAALQGKLNASVFIFNAKNNHGYRDTQEISQTITGKVIGAKEISQMSDQELNQKLLEYSEEDEE